MLFLTFTFQQKQLFAKNLFLDRNFSHYCHCAAFLFPPLLELELFTFSIWWIGQKTITNSLISSRWWIINCRNLSDIFAKYEIVIIESEMSSPIKEGITPSLCLSSHANWNVFIVIELKMLPLRWTKSLDATALYPESLHTRIRITILLEQYSNEVHRFATD